MNNKSITTKDVAKKAGVSTATAARVLGSYGSVKPETKEKVMKAAEELGYIPNVLARSLAKLKTHTIGLVIPDICNSFFSQLVRSVEKKLKKTGYRSFVCDTDASFITEENYLQDLYERRVDGIILSSSIGYDKSSKIFDKLKIPVVMVDRVVSGLKADSVQTNHKNGAYKIVKHLISLNHKRIGIVLGTGNESPHLERLLGYKKALNEASIPYDPKLVKKRDWEKGLKIVDEYLTMKNKPTAIFTSNNVVTIGVLADLKRLGLNIPEDMAVAAFDDLNTGELLESPLTAVVQDPVLIGKTAAELLLRRIKNDNDFPLQQKVFDPKLIIRSSCGSNYGNNDK